MLPHTLANFPTHYSFKAQTDTPKKHFFFPTTLTHRDRLGKCKRPHPQIRRLLRFYKPISRWMAASCDLSISGTWTAKTARRHRKLETVGKQNACRTKCMNNVWKFVLCDRGKRHFALIFARCVFRLACGVLYCFEVFYLFFSAFLVWNYVVWGVLSSTVRKYTNSCVEYFFEYDFF